MKASGTSIYLVIPLHRLQGASPLVATLFNCLINALCSRTKRPERRTLFLLDEVAQLGRMQEFIAAKTLLRGYGVQVWSFWQDLSQLQSIYEGVWPTSINNCKVVQAFGCSMPLMASGLEEVFDVPREAIMGLAPDEMLLSVYGDDIVTARRPVYFSDPAFEGTFANNTLATDRRPVSSQQIDQGLRFVVETRHNKRFRTKRKTG